MSQSRKSDKSGKASTRQHPPVAQCSGQFKLKPESELYSEDTTKYDCCAYIICCADHDRVLITRQNNHRWMPFISLPPNRSWKDTGLKGFCRIVAGSSDARFKSFLERPPFQWFRCLQVARLQLPQTLKFIKRVIFYIKLKPSSDEFKCCQPIAPHLEWAPVKDICADRVSQFWGPELMHCCQLITSSEWKPSKQKIIEVPLEQAIRFLPREPARNLEELMLNSVQITPLEVFLLYNEFLEFCFPSFCMTLHSFMYFMAQKFDFEKNPTRLKMLFNAFNWSAAGWLTFPELLMGLACMEQQSVHGEYRSRFIFRFFDVERRGKLNRQQLKCMAAEMYPEKEVDARVNELMTATGSENEITEDNFVYAIDTFKLPHAVINLCRSSKPIFTKLKRSIAFKYCSESRLGIKRDFSKILLDRRYKDVVCPTCKEKRYSVASHLARIDLENCIVCKRLPQVPLSEPKKSSNVISAQQYSIECVFKMSNAANSTIRLVREFSPLKGTPHVPRGLLAAQRDHLWQLLLQLFNDVCLLLSEESKCHRVFSPCYIIGDIHGNLEDLLTIERQIWKQMPCIGPNFLFLGDYVDRGMWGFECALYLIAFKILCPNKVTLLRGNHEVRSLQSNYTFKNECIYKYGEVFGLKIWELTNRVFDRLPVCAVLDDTIYCAHGGIPYSATQIDQIRAVQRIIHEPQHESDIVWEILWSDPCNQQEFLDTCRTLKPVEDSEDENKRDGFVFNTKRGTAFKFNETGATGFLRDNMLTHIIRAHEVVLLGYEFHFGQKCITIFSSSHYCGNDNRCGFLLADNQRLRVIHLDTGNNASATD